MYFFSKTLQRRRDYVNSPKPTYTKGEPKRLSPQKYNVPSDKKDSEEYVRVILDLKIKGLSLNDIRDHLKNCHKIQLSHRKIKNILVRYGEKANKLNQYYDKKVFPKIQVAEADEIYQGRNSMHIGIAEKFITYLINFDQVNAKDEDTFVEFFSQFKNSFPALKVWLTDGLASYNSPLNSIFENAVHIRCHVHIYREIMNEQDIYNRKANREYQKLKDVREKLVFIRSRIVQNDIELNEAQKRLNNMLVERDEFYQKNNIKKYSKEKKMTHKRAKYRNEINSIRSLLRNATISSGLWNRKRLKLEKILYDAQRKYQKAKIISLQSGRLVSMFKDLLDCHWKDYGQKKERFLMLLLKSSYPIAKKIVQIVKNKSKLFNDKSESIQTLISPNQVNTNTIESIFGRYRLFFKKYRSIKHSQYSRAVFSLLRLNHNFSPPYTGLNREISPIMRIGIKTKYRNALECLCGD